MSSILAQIGQRSAKIDEAFNQHRASLNEKRRQVAILEQRVNLLKGVVDAISARTPAIEQLRKEVGELKGRITFTESIAFLEGYEKKTLPRWKKTLFEVDKVRIATPRLDLIKEWQPTLLQQCEDYSSQLVRFKAEKNALETRLKQVQVVIDQIDKRIPAIDDLFVEFDEFVKGLPASKRVLEASGPLKEYLIGVNDSIGKIAFWLSDLEQVKKGDWLALEPLQKQYQETIRKQFSPPKPLVDKLDEVVAEFKQKLSEGTDRAIQYLEVQKVHFHEALALYQQLSLKANEKNQQITLQVRAPIAIAELPVPTGSQTSRWSVLSYLWPSKSAPKVVKCHEVVQHLLQLDWAKEEKVRCTFTGLDLLDSDGYKLDVRYRVLLALASNRKVKPLAMELMRACPPARALCLSLKSDLVKFENQRTLEIQKFFEGFRIEQSVGAPITKEKEELPQSLTGRVYGANIGYTRNFFSDYKTSLTTLQNEVRIWEEENQNYQEALFQKSSEALQRIQKQLEQLVSNLFLLERLAKQTETFFQNAPPILLNNSSERLQLSQSFAKILEIHTKIGVQVVFAKDSLRDTFSFLSRLITLTKAKLSVEKVAWRLLQQEFMLRTAEGNRAHTSQLEQALGSYQLANEEFELLWKMAQDAYSILAPILSRLDYKLYGTPGYVTGHYWGYAPQQQAFINPFTATPQKKPSVESEAQ